MSPLPPLTVRDSKVPADSEIAQEKAHYDALYAHTNSRQPLPAHVVANREIPLWNKYVGALKGKRVLECGSGDGEKAVWLATQGALVQAVELSPIGVERTLERAQAQGVAARVKAYPGDCTELEKFITPDSIDLALGFSVLHHFPAVAFGRSLHAVLKPGGRAVFFENSNANPLYRFLRGLKNNESACGSPLTQGEVRELVQLVGAGEPIFPRFGLFAHAKKYIFRNNTFFAALMDTTDRVIDAIPGSRRWSSHMWVVLEKPLSSALPKQ